MEIVFARAYTNLDVVMERTEANATAVHSVINAHDEYVDVLDVDVIDYDGAQKMTVFCRRHKDWP
jgi:hypothetical protein